MATWGELSRGDPDLAATAKGLLTVPGTGFGYLATVGPDGAPRIHPVMPVWAAGSMFAFIGPSPKLRDLERDGRYALHSTGSEDVDDELMIVGRGVVRGEEELRAAATAACPFVPAEDTALVELFLDRVMWAHYAPRGVFPPQYVVWRDGAGGPGSSER
ncbi:pyridoxamine 5'-phosphate oxidase family protein [Actinotalea sp. Marseille-Q4924]|uniref:pyridoxamine 5'-phosphate oxidase family protein n=1 Tax=Actinotalea sp. Marseille-Q4924 TaxID=2866571 RepID=UPI001CE3E30E|nr:pyridoxamine 5'-phosphate oxidase family protein [Actinotalea sp. Marseille-Q4924]